MDSFDKVVEILESKGVKTLATAIGLMVGFLKLSDSAKWKPVQSVATVFLVLTVFYFFIIIPREIVHRIRRQNGQSEPESDAEKSYQYTSKGYGVGYRSLEVECTIRPDGSARVQRRMEVEAHSDIRQLDTFLLVPEQPPLGKKWEGMGFIDIESKTPNRDVSLIPFLQQDGKLSAWIGISPPLGEGESVTYELREQLPLKLYAIDLTEEEQAKRKTLDDYFGWTINRPTRKLSLKVYFPEGTKPKDYSPEVRYASAAPGIPSELFQHEEQKRLEKLPLKGPEGNRYIFMLNVDYPMIGLIYILRWRFLRKEPEKTPEQMEQTTKPAEENAESIE